MDEPDDRLCRAQFPIRTDQLYLLDCVLPVDEHGAADVDGETVVAHRIASGQWFYLETGQ